MILNSMLQNSPVAAVLVPLLALLAYGMATVLGTLARWMRGPGSGDR